MKILGIYKQLSFTQRVIALLAIFFIIGLFMPSAPPGYNKPMVALPKLEEKTPEFTPEQQRLIEVKTRQIEAEHQADLARKQAEADTLCFTNLNCIGNKLAEQVFVPCQIAVNKLSTIDNEWDFFGQNFKKYAWFNPEKTIVILSGDSVKFKNAFGVDMPMIYSCYVTTQGVVINADVKPGKL